MEVVHGILEGLANENSTRFILTALQGIIQATNAQLSGALFIFLCAAIVAPNTNHLPTRHHFSKRQLVPVQAGPMASISKASTYPQANHQGAALGAPSGSHSQENVPDWQATGGQHPTTVGQYNQRLTGRAPAGKAQVTANGIHVRRTGVYIMLSAQGRRAAQAPVSLLVGVEARTKHSPIKSMKQGIHIWA